MANHTTLTDPTIQQPGFKPPCCNSLSLNQFQTGQGPWFANMQT